MGTNDGEGMTTQLDSHANMVVVGQQATVFGVGAQPKPEGSPGRGQLAGGRNDGAAARQAPTRPPGDEGGLIEPYKGL